MSTVEDGEMSSLQCTLSQRHLKTSNEMERGQTQVDILQEKLIVDVTAGLHGSNENSEKEMEIISRRVKTIATLLNYLKYKERIVSVPHLAHASCTLKLLEELDLTDEDSTSMSAWSSNVDMSSLESPDESSWIKSADHDPRGLVDREDPAYLDEILKVVQMVTDLMEILVKRVIIAESQTELEKEKATLGQEEVKRKTTQIESMYVKLDEMERFAIGTNSVLIEMKQRVEDLVEETCRQRQRAVDNEHELCRVKQDFESLKSYVSSLISVRETLLSSEKQFQTIERLFERLVAKTNQLEGEKVQKDVEVSKLMEENVKLNALLDKKEAQLLAMNEQCKVMALSTSSI